MKVTYEYDIVSVHEWKNNRIDGIIDILTRWSTVSESNIGGQYMRYKNGVIEVKKCPFERTDIAVLQYSSFDNTFLANVFIEADGSYDIQHGEPTKDERARIQRDVDTWFANNKEYVLRHQHFFAHLKDIIPPLHGLTPDAALDKFTALCYTYNIIKKGE